jgi:PAS domain S-box-containing protein
VVTPVSHHAPTCLTHAGATASSTLKAFSFHAGNRFQATARFNWPCGCRRLIQVKADVKSVVAPSNPRIQMPMHNPLSTSACAEPPSSYRRRLARWAALGVILIGSAVLLGWLLDAPLLKSVFPGAVQMKANTAMALLLSGTGLFLCAEERLRMPPAAVLAPALAVALLGAVTAAQYAGGFDAGIDELLFRDRAQTYNNIPGRMSPYTAVAFVLFGTGMAALHTRRFRRPGRVAACLIGFIGVSSLLGYLWNASDIITDELLPPVAVHTAIALVLLAGGMLLVAGEFQAIRGTAKAKTEIEARVLGAFIGVVLLLALAGRYTYQSGAHAIAAADGVFEAQGLRTELNQTYADLSDAESALHFYVLTGEPGHKSLHLGLTRRIEQHVAQLLDMARHGSVPQASIADLQRLVAQRLAAFSQVASAYEREGLGSVQALIKQEQAVEVMQAIRSLAVRIDSAQAVVIEQGQAAVESNRRRTLGALMVALTAAAAILTALFFGIRRAMMARLRAEAELEHRVEERTAELSYQQAFLRKVVDMTPAYIFVKDRQGRFTFANEAVAQAFGTTVADLMGKTDADVNAHHDEVQNFHRDDLQVMESLQELIIPEERLTDATGQVRWLRTMKRPMLAPDGTSTMVLGVGIDITRYRAAQVAIQEMNAGLERRVDERTRELRSLNAQLELARAGAEQASAAKSAFLATMSHEIRTPINGVIGMVDVLSHSEMSAQQADAVRTIRDSAQMLLRLIDDILDFSKIEAGHMSLERAAVALPNLVEGVCRSLVPVAAVKGVDIDVFIDPSAPSQVWTDPTRVQQVLYNLVGNAIKFSSNRAEQSGHVSVRMDVAQAQPLQLALRVVDNGIGMTPDTMAVIFDAFRQGEMSTTRRFGGTGLGLAICERLVKLMGGSIEVQSSPGVGSCFTVTLPLEPAPEVDELRWNLHGVDCIVVDEGAGRADVLATYLRHAGADVVVAHSLVEAIVHGRSRPNPIVIHTCLNLGEGGADSLVDRFPKEACHLVLVKGQGTRLMRPGMLSVGRNGMGPGTFLHAAAAAAGCASPEILAEPLGAAGIGSASELPPGIEDARKQGMLVLVAEDEPVNQKVILQQLRLLGYAAEIVNDGVEALEWLKQGGHALLLTDLHMPRMDGYELTQAIRETERAAGGSFRLPVLALTANALRSERAKAKAAGVDEYLVKPLPLPQLKAILEQWMPVPRSPSAAVVLDTSVLVKLVGDDSAVVEALLSEYLSSARELHRDLQTADADHDIKRLGDMAHRLKSSSRSVGALDLASACQVLEDASRGGRPALLRAAKARVEDALEQVQSCLTERLGSE